MTRKALIVAWWEYSEKIRSKAFIVSLILFPALMVFLVVVPTLFIAGPDTTVREVGLVDETGSYVSAFVDHLGERYRIGDSVRNYRVTDLVRAAGGDPALGKRLGDSLVLADQLEGYFILRVPGGEIVDAEYRTGNIGNVRSQEKLNSALREAVTAVRVRKLGMDPEAFAAISRSVRFRTMKVEGEGTISESTFEETFFGVYVYMMMLFFLILTSGQLLVRSMLEEKSNRIVELLLSSLSARDLMAGKILGLGAIGLSQMLCWGTFVFIVGQVAGMRVLSAGNALFLLLYFVLGYLLYTGIFVSAGAPVSTEQEAQQVTSLFSFGLIVPLALSFPVMQDPQSMFSVVLTMIPVFTPMMMAIRIPVEMPSALEIAASILLLGGSAYFMMTVAGRIFSAAVLLRGKRLTLREVVAMLKMS